MFYLNITYHISKGKTEIFRKYPSIYSFCKRLYYTAQYIVAKIGGYRIQPFSHNWMVSCYLTTCRQRRSTYRVIKKNRSSTTTDAPIKIDYMLKQCNRLDDFNDPPLFTSNGLNPFLDEKLKHVNLEYDLSWKYQENEIIPFIDDYNDNIKQIAFQECQHLSTKVNITSYSGIQEGLFILSVAPNLLIEEGAYISRSFFTNHFYDENIMQNHFALSIKSGVKFLSVEYHHPRMKDNIYLEIDPQFYWKDNQLLSPLFIRYLLEYQNKSFMFDDNYIVRIMDNHIHLFEITIQHYIVLNEYDYTICNI